MGVEVQYHAIEKFPITPEEAIALGEAGMQGALPYLLATPNVPLKVGDSSFTLFVEDLRTFTAEQGAYDLIYFKPDIAANSKPSSKKFILVSSCSIKAVTCYL